MPNDAAREWTAYWAREGESGEVFVDAEGNKHPALTRFWRDVFAGLASRAAVLDVASGAGSIYADLPAGHGHELHATDLSARALDRLRERLDAVHAVVCSADRLPYPDARFDLVVSQFGAEYAGRGAIREAARTVRDGGRLVMLCHYRDGYIDRRNAAELAGAEMARDSGFIDRAIELTEAVFGHEPERRAAAERAFIEVERPYARAVKTSPGGVRAHLYAGFRRLYGKRAQYDAADITGWLEAMRGELERVIQRLTAMRAAALSADDTALVSGDLEALGYAEVSVRPFTVDGHDLPIAWHVAARRRAAVSNDRAAC